MPGPYNSIYSGKNVDKMVKRALEGRGIKIDSIVDENSLNPVENRAIKAYIDGRFGLDRIFATVKVIYNESDTIVASNGSTTINSNTSGIYIFSIPFSGEWTFHAEIVDKTETINVIEKGFQYSIDLTGEFPVRRSSWTYGTDQDIVDIVNALDNGTMTIEDTGWIIGDEREVELTFNEVIPIVFPHSSMPSGFNPSENNLYENFFDAGQYILTSDTKPVGNKTYYIMDQSNHSQKVTLVLMDSRHFDLVNGGKDHFVVGLKEVLINTKQMFDDAATMEASWSISNLRTWCNNDFLNSFSNPLKTIFKPFICKSSYSHNDNYYNITTETTHDYFSLFAEKEIFGTTDKGFEEEASELTQIIYYANDKNRYKHIYGDTSLGHSDGELHNHIIQGPAHDWLTRSVAYVEFPSYSPYRPGYNNRHWFANVFYNTSNFYDSHADTNIIIQNRYNFISPFGCI